MHALLQNFLENWLKLQNKFNRSHLNMFNYNLFTILSIFPLLRHLHLNIPDLHPSPFYQNQQAWGWDGPQQRWSPEINPYGDGQRAEQLLHCLERWNLRQDANTSPKCTTDSRRIDRLGQKKQNKLSLGAAFSWKIVKNYRAQIKNHSTWGKQKSTAKPAEVTLKAWLCRSCDFTKESKNSECEVCGGVRTDIQGATASKQIVDLDKELGELYQRPTGSSIFLFLKSVLRFRSTFEDGSWWSPDTFQLPTHAQVPSSRTKPSSSSTCECPTMPHNATK